MLELTYAKFKNFAGLYVGTGLKTIEIDFTKMENNICLIVGGNGSGKTTLMESLHPKAYNVGNDRNEDIIISKKDGYKELQYYDNSTDIKYMIKHIYQYKNNTRSVKSYITKFIEDEEIELNPNGNVGSFNEVLELELNFTDTHLTLTRLGPNMRGLISKKPSERKKFMSSILSALNIYTHYYKIINEKYREVKTTLKNVVDKISKLKYTDKSEINKRIEKLTKEKDIMYNNIVTLNNEIQEMEKKISELSEYEDKFNYLSQNYKSLKNKREGLYKRLNKLQKIDIIEDYIKSSDSINKGYIEVVNELNNMKVKIGRLLSDKDNILKNISSIEIELDKMDLTDSNEYDYEEKVRLENIINNYNEEIDEIEVEYDFTKNMVLNVSKEDLIIGRSYVKKLKEYINSIDDYEESTLEKFYKIYKDKKIDKIITEYQNLLKELKDITRKEEDLNIKLERYYTNKKYLDILDNRPENCTIDSCPFISDALRFKDLQEKIYEVEDKISKLVKDKRAITFKLYSRDKYISLNNDIKAVYKYIKENKSILEKLPFNELYINKKALVKTICSKLDLTYIDDYDKIIHHIDKYNYYIDIVSYKLPYVNKELELVNAKISTYENNSVSNKKNELIKLKETMYRLDNDIETYNETTLGLELLQAEYEVYMEINESINSIESEIKEVQNEYLSIQDIIKEVRGMKTEKDKIKNNIEYYDRSIKPIDKEVDNLKYIKKTYKDLIKEKELLDLTFFEIDLIRDSLSTTKGIPLEYIDMYLKETRVMANELLSDCFDGELILEEFIINEKEFNMPVNIKGYINSDAGYTSDGQRSLLALVLSFAFIRQNLNKYSILLLDEIDGPLDDYHRRFFISTLEKQMDMIQSKQAFIISHNPEFSRHNVDIILMDNKYKNKYVNDENINIIFFV